jgi:methionyl-tRNA formyltransferase
VNLGVLCSGNLGLQVLKLLVAEYRIEFVFTDSGSKRVKEYCESQGLPIFIGNPRENKSKPFLSSKSCDVILSINYLFIIEEELINFPNLYSINVHGSLLPKYRGRTPHVWAIINNENKTGVTAHLIDSGCDTGDIIEQIEVEISKEETGASILDKFNKLYFPLIKSVLSKIQNKQIEPIPQNHSQATFFGKRTPEDGMIDWNWQKERILNWVRAQSNPYPGAFTYVNEKKLTIDKISFSDDGFDSQIANGTILSINPLKVKTQNGVIQIDQYREKIDNIMPLKTILR